MSAIRLSGGETLQRRESRTLNGALGKGLQGFELAGSEILRKMAPGSGADESGAAV